jgi:hypothetical protein
MVAILPNPLNLPWQLWFHPARRHTFGRYLRRFNAVGAVNSFALRCLATQVDFSDKTCARELQ